MPSHNRSNHNRPLEIAWLKDFLALASTQNFSRAAELRAIAQPAFSRHIRALEEWANVELVDRSAHPALLTAAGQKFLPLIEEILASLEAARIKAQAAQDLASASLRFTCTHALAVTFFPQWLGSIESMMKLGSIQTMTDHFQACEDLMLQRQAQFLLCYGHEKVAGRLDGGQFKVVQLGSDVLLPVYAPALAAEPSDQLPWLAYSETSGLGRIIRQLQTSSNLSTFSTPNALLLKNMAIAGRGIAWLPQSMIVQELAHAQLHIANTLAEPIPIKIRLYRQSAQMTQMAENLWTYVTKLN